MNDTHSSAASHPPSLGRRGLSSVAWNAAAGLSTLPLLFIHSILLARLLPVAYFGIFAGILALTDLSYAFLNSAAVLHPALRGLLPWRLFGPPVMALSAALGLGWLLADPVLGLWDGWALLLKSLAFGSIYALALLLLEGRRLMEMIRQVMSMAGIR